MLDWFQQLDHHRFYPFFLRSIDYLQHHKLWVLVHLAVLSVLTFWALTTGRSSAQSPRKMSSGPPQVDLRPPKDDPITIEELSRFDGSDPSKPIYVAIKGIVFDVSAKREVYGPGGSYHVFAGKDGSKGLGKSSLKPEDATSDYSSLDENESKVLADWVSFFKKRYNIVGKVVNKTVNL
ncbi:hypothetical protein O181_074170 [Austropuccinia psidii MF-1]|uniref:Cytochrome b5 heme-binding domain-containing protein n=1 Tax=Austropuccinia psidii MF-1 TaxID=1389203 RepID=A0A9Q3FBW3_9BASI|nr:hypothetical protein [Austropuccinia psidii MF-1]